VNATQAIAIAMLILAACAVDDGTADPADPSGESSGMDGVPIDPSVDPSMDPGADAWPSPNCPPYGSDVYTPFLGAGPFPLGDVATYPWRGPSSTYPDGMEDFRGYGTSMPVNVECGGTRGARSYLEVTAGCLDAVADGASTRGQIHVTADGYYRSFALPFAASDHVHPVKWTDQGVEYRFYYTAQTGNEGNPGFKAFVRYRTEYDLYVGSWRMDGVVQIQKKQCGVYTILQRNGSYGAPTPNTWHTIRFQVTGNRIELYLDGKLAMTQIDNTFASGTAGIRIDSLDGALIDDWRVFAPK
jgi:hypothetical protein